MRVSPALNRFWLGLAAGLTLTVLASEVRYINWKPVAAPIDGVLHVRQDAKGDGRFGAPRSGNRIHRGVDLMASMESPVRAIRSGKIAEVGTHRGLGRFIKIAHGRGLTSLYAHLAKTMVQEGDRVVQGQLIGAVGKTGNARHRWIEPHLHLEVARQGKVFDPAQLGLRVLASSSPVESADGRGGD